MAAKKTKGADGEESTDLVPTGVPEEVKRQLAGLSPEQLQQVITAVRGQGAQQPGQSPKLSAALEHLSEDEAREVVEACKAGLEGGAKGNLKPLQDASPLVASAAATNSTYRGKDAAHSLRTIVANLTHRFPALAAEQES